MPLISASICPSVLLHLFNKVRRLLGALCVLALPLTLQAQVPVLSFAGLQTTLTATNSAPIAIAIDASGNRYILNHAASNITKVSAVGTETTIAVTLTSPSAIAVDGSGNMYVADTSSTHIIELPAAGGTAINVGSGFLHPAGVAVDTAGNVYVADSGHGLVKKVAVVGATISTITGTYSNPVGLSVAGSNLYISDIGSTSVFKVPIIGTSPVVTTVLTNLTNLPYDISADTLGDVFLSGGTDHRLTMYGANGSIRQLGTSLTQAEGTALDGTGSVYVTDQAAPAIDIIAPGSVDLGQVNLCPSSGTPTPCSQTVTLNFNVGSSANLSSVTTRVVTQGVANIDFTSTNNTCTGTLTGPTTCSITAVFKPLAPGVRLGAVDVGGIVGSASTPTLLATVPLHGIGMGSLAGFDAGIINTVPVTVGDALAPSSVISDSAGDLYFIDHASCVVDKFNPYTTMTSAVAGSVCGAAAGSGGPATSAVLQDPYRLAINGRGDLFISDDASNVIWKVDALTQVITQIAGIAGTPAYNVNVVAQGNSIGYPYALALDGAGDLYFSDYGFQVVQKIDANTGVLTTVAGSETEGAGYTGDGGPATSAQLHNPIGLTIDDLGNFYIVDVGNEVIRKVTASTGIITTVAGVPGTAGYTGDGGLATSAELGDPEGIAVDAAGNLYIADTNNYVVRKVNASTGIISTIVGTATGTAEYSGDGGAANLAGLNDLADVALDSIGDIYIADNANNAIRAVTPASGIASFGTFNMGTSSPAIDVVVTNDGNLPLDLSALTAPSNFNLGGADTSCTASTTLAVGAECVLGIEFLPAAVGSLTGSLTLTDDVSNDPTSTQTISLTGTGAYVPAQVVLTGVPSTITTGGNLGTVQATIESSDNHVVTNSTAAVTATVTGPGNYSGTVTADAAGGVASLDLSSLVLSNPGAYTVTAASSGLTSGVETSQAVAPPHLVLSALPASIPAGGNLGTATVSIENSTGAVVTGSSASVTLAITGPSNYTQTLAVAASSGVATFNLTSLTLTNTGTYTVTATSAGDTSTTTIVTVVAPPATQLALSGIPATIVTGGNLGTATVSIETASGSVVTTTSASVTLTVTGPGGYSHVLTVSARSGVATFSLSSLTLTNAGTYTVTATSSGLTMATSTVNVIVPPATQLVVTGLPTTIAAGGNLGTVMVTIKDASGIVVITSTAAVTITITGPGSYSQVVTQAAANGVATLDLSGLALTTAGTYTATTTSAGLPSVTSTVAVTFTITSAQGSATVAAGGAATYTLSLPATTSTYAQPVSFTASGLPAGATASFSPATLTPGPAAVSTTLTIQTAASTAVLHGLRGLGGIAMGLLLLPFAGSRRLRRAAGQTPMLSLLFGLLSAGALFGLAGCGGGGSQVSTPTPHSYTITVTGTSGGASGSTTVTLTVQ